MQQPFTRLFPTPPFFSIPSIGLDFSDATMRFIKLKQTLHGIVPQRYAEVAIPSGCMQGGKIINNDSFVQFLKEVKNKYDLKYVRVALPESQIYSFTLSIDIEAAEDIRSAIELVLEDNIPLKTVEAVFDYQVLSQNDKNIIVQVAATSEIVSQDYHSAFVASGIIPVSFELDSQATTRAIVPKSEKGSYMIVDFGAYRTEITIVTNGTAIYTSTLDFGGKTLINSLAKELNISEEEADKLKHEYGLSSTGPHKDIFSILVGGISTLKDEINRRFVYWHERKDQVGSFPSIEKIYLSGGHSNLKGLADYLKVTLKLDVAQGNPWVNCLSFDDAIPAIPYESSMSYATAIGLALADYIYD